MREHPDGAELLAMAREVLRTELLPLLPKEKAYEALMIMNAMGIAERQLQQGDGPAQEEKVRLAHLLGRQGNLAELNRWFAQGIRAGNFDENRNAVKMLVDFTRQRVRESAPKALSAATT